jgi:LPPG:FO 2-phospho-L-lactate transferase
MKVVALAGGVGGAKLADGLADCLSPQDLTVIVNVGDDFEHLDLKICPDLDTVCYTLAGIANPATGWGRQDESWNALDSLVKLGGPSWFRIGDRDLGTHLERTRRLRGGDRLSQITVDFCNAWGVRLTVLPATDDLVQTWVYTDVGELPFQEYFVHRQCQPKVTGFRFENVEQATPAPGVLESIHNSDLVIFCPSNPWVSIDPIIAVPGIRGAMVGKHVVAVSPIIGGLAIKGPAAKMYAELGIEPSALSVAQHYHPLLSGFVFDNIDIDQAGALTDMGVKIFITDTIMKYSADRTRLAKEVLKFGEKLLHNNC